MVGFNPCLRCGACCAMYKVTFPQAEASDHEGGKVPVGLTVSQKGVRKAMKGTELGRPRCVALEGNVGSKVHCSIYLNRCSTCRDFLFSGENDMINPLCDRARGYYGLQPLISDIF